MQAKLKREDWKHTKHDFVVSRWEILIGPNDWEDHAYGKDGVERYRIHNLPAACSCCGLYELGVAFIPTTESHGLRKHDWDVITVYLGQADNIRTRLQEYGRTGSHLDHGNLIASRKNHDSSPQGLGLFKDIFSKGYSIMFRWAPIKSKVEAEKMEIELLSIFDYAWNRKGNGTCRHGDILAKLIHNSPKPCHSPMRRLLQWKNEAINKRVGVKIDESAPLFKESAPPHGLECHLLPRILKFFSSRIQVLPQDVNPVNVQIICGVATGHGSVCINRPLPRRKRCAEHKGKKITANGATSRVMNSPSDILLEDGTKGWELSKGIRVSSPLSDEIYSPFQQNQSQLVAEDMFHHGKKKAGICGVVYGDGVVCMRSPVSGRQRCESHKGQRVSSPLSDGICSPFQQNQSQSVAEEMFHHGKKEAGICGVVCGDGVVCMRSPVSGRQRCESHKGQRVCSPPSDEICSPFQQNQSQSVAQIVFHDDKKDTGICGVVYGGGIVCRRSPVLGRQRCESHKGQRVRSPLSYEICSPFQQYQSQFHHDKKETGNCGVVDSDGYECMRSPVYGRKRCESHKGQRVLTTTPVDKIFNSRQFNDKCGVIDGYGFACSRLPVHGRKRCEAHKGRRLV